MSVRCPKCGAEIPKEGDSCPACLMNLALGEVVRAEASEEADAGSLEAETQLGSAIGPYTLERILGEGGMGIVYLARQAEPIQRQVALKVIKIGMDSREVLARFDIERQTLALMDHPNIARVIDAGATSGGRPYFVMEHVDGVPITEYCDGGRLGVGERVALFLSVCEAIQHAHLKGIIHRDLKPGNVLVAEVDGRPVPKVIDFGLAKATRQGMAERTAFTRFGRLIGTPEYMSPEQAGLVDGDIDSRTDLYSLGILLYEILAGAPPLDAAELRGAGLEGLLRKIREAPSPRPSVRISSLGEAGVEIANNRRTDRATLMRRLQGDLDWVVMKTIEKDRERRYATVQELAADLRRYLNHEPVEAGPPGALYRLGKFVRRHRLGVGTAAAVLIALVLGVVGTSLGWVRALRAERRAAQEAETAQQVSDFLVDLFRVSRPGNVPADTITAPDILAQGAERIRSDLAGQPLIQARMMFTISGVYRSLDLQNEGLPLAEEAYRIRERELPADHFDLSTSLVNLGTLLEDLGRFDEAEEKLTEANAIQDRTLDPEDPRRIPALSNLAGLYTARGRFQESESLFRRALELGDKEFGAGNPELAILYMNLGSVLSSLGRLEEAEQLLTGALEKMRGRVGDDHVSYALAASVLAVLYQRQNRLDEAIPLFRQVVEIQERNLGPVHNNLAGSIGSLAVCYAMQGHYEEAAPLFLRVFEISEELYGPDHVDVGRALVNVGNIQRDLGDYDAAEEAYLRSADILERRLGEAEDLAMVYGNLAGLYGRQGKDEDSLALHRRALAIREKTLGPEHPSTAMSMDNVAATLRDLGQLDEAEPLLLRGLAIREKTLPADHPNIAKSLNGLAILYREQGRDAEAVETFERAIEMRKKSLGPDHPHLAHSLSALAVLHRDRGRTEAAEKLFKQALEIMENKYETDHPRMREMLKDYAVLLRQTGRAGEAGEMEARAQAIGGS
jgi:non-specific serine/threonine protein kinase/serine/threonine-protein kinase